MREVVPALQRFFFVVVLTCVGCDQVQTGEPRPTDGDVSRAPVCTQYAPVKIEIAPLTEFVRSEGAEPGIALYVSLLDSFGSQIKSPATFRFELYQRVRLSAEPKGRRVKMWPDVDPSDPNESNRHWIDLSEPPANNRYWRDFLRAYEFDLPFEPAENQDYILQVTCLTPDAKRISTEYSLQYTK